MRIEYPWESFRILPGRFVNSAPFIYLSNHLYQYKFMDTDFIHFITQYYTISYNTTLSLKLFWLWKHTHIYIQLYIHTDMYVHIYIYIYIYTKSEVNRRKYVLFSPLNELLLTIT